MRFLQFIYPHQALLSFDNREQFLVQFFYNLKIYNFLSKLAILKTVVPISGQNFSFANRQPKVWGVFPTSSSGCVPHLNSQVQDMFLTSNSQVWGVFATSSLGHVHHIKVKAQVKLKFRSLGHVPHLKSGHVPHLKLGVCPPHQAWAMFPTSSLRCVPHLKFSLCNDNVLPTSSLGVILPMYEVHGTYNNNYMSH